MWLRLKPGEILNVENGQDIAMVKQLADNSLFLSEECQVKKKDSKDHYSLMHKEITAFFKFVLTYIEDPGLKKMQFAFLTNDPPTKRTPRRDIKWTGRQILSAWKSILANIREDKGKIDACCQVQRMLQQCSGRQEIDMKLTVNVINRVQFRFSDGLEITRETVITEINEHDLPPNVSAHDVYCKLISFIWDKCLCQPVDCRSLMTSKNRDEIITSGSVASAHELKVTEIAEGSRQGISAKDLCKRLVQLIGKILTDPEYEWVESKSTLRGIQNRMTQCVLPTPKEVAAIFNVLNARPGGL